jgi:hypothetical protein
MKKVVLIVGLLAMAVSSCKKEETSKEETVADGRDVLIGNYSGTVNNKFLDSDADTILYEETQDNFTCKIVKSGTNNLAISIFNSINELVLTTNTTEIAKEPNIENYFIKISNPIKTNKGDFSGFNPYKTNLYHGLFNFQEGKNFFLNMKSVNSTSLEYAGENYENVSVEASFNFKK